MSAGDGAFEIVSIFPPGSNKGGKIFVRSPVRSLVADSENVATAGFGAVHAADHITFHDTAAHAIAGTNLVVLSAVGSGVSQLVEQEPLVIHTEQGFRVTFPVAAITGMPELNFGSLVTLFGGVTFEIFRKNSTPWSTDYSLFTVDYAPYSYVGPDKTLILTKQYNPSWGAVAPFDAFETRGPISVRFNLGLSPFESDQQGVLSRLITGLSVSISCQPYGISHAQLAQYLDLQGASTGRGARRTMNDFMVAAADNTAFGRFYNASLKAAPQQFDATNPLAGTLEWETARMFKVDGTPHPIFAVATTAPGV